MNNTPGEGALTKGKQNASFFIEIWPQSTSLIAIFCVSLTQRRHNTIPSESNFSYTWLAHLIAYSFRFNNIKWIYEKAANQ